MSRWWRRRLRRAARAATMAASRPASLRATSARQRNAIAATPRRPMRQPALITAPYRDHASAVTMALPPRASPRRTLLPKPIAAPATAPTSGRVPSLTMRKRPVRLAPRATMARWRRARRLPISRPPPFAKTATQSRPGLVPRSIMLTCKALAPAATMAQRRPANQPITLPPMPNARPATSRLPRGSARQLIMRRSRNLVRAAITVLPPPANRRRISPPRHCAPIATLRPRCGLAP